MAKIQNMKVPVTSNPIQIKIKMPNPSQEPPASSKATNQDLKDMDILCTFKIKIESQNSDHGYVKASDHIQIKIKMIKPIQEPTVSSKAPNEYLKDMDILWTVKLKIESQNSEHWCIEALQPYPNQDQDAKPKSGASSIL